MNIECKAMLTVASFHNASGQFCKPAWCFKSSTFVRSRVNIQVYLIVRFVQQGFIDGSGRDPRRLQLLFLIDADKSC